MSALKADRRLLLATQNDLVTCEGPEGRVIQYPTRWIETKGEYFELHGTLLFEAQRSTSGELRSASTKPSSTSS